MQKTVLITGASSGFGRATAEHFAKEGYRLVLVARREEKLEELKNTLQTEIYTASVDVSNKKAVKDFFTTLPQEFKEIDILVNCAGLALGMELVPDGNPDDWDVMIDTNIKGLLYFTKFALLGMRERNRGHIVNIASIAATIPYKGGNVYGGTKAFVKQFSRNLRTDLLGTDIRVSNIEPGMAETEFSVVRFKGDKEKAKKVYEGTRSLRPEDIARAIVWVTGQPIHVNIDTLEIMSIDQTFGGQAFNRSENE